jgi:membrane protein DedA with SNARE-associated domain
MDGLRVPMGVIEDLIQWGVDLIMTIISTLGYPGVVALMTLESMCIPIPSEVVLPFAGASVVLGGMGITGDPWWDTFLVGLCGTLGCTIGSVIAYYIGLKGGRPFIDRYGKYVRLNHHHLEVAECWFRKYGDWAVFGSRLVPIVRTFISLPAGIACMPFKRFVILSTLGSIPWCMMLAFIGMYLGENWETVENLYRPMEVVVVIGVVALVAFYVVRWRTARKVCPP